MPDWKDVGSLLQRMPLLFAQAPEPIAMVRFDAGVQFANDAFLALFGFSSIAELHDGDVAVAVGLWELVHSAAFLAAADAGQLGTVRAMIHPVGQLVPIPVAAAFARAFVDGDPVGVYVRVTDLTIQTRLAAELDALERSTQQLQILFDHAPQAIASIDLAGRFLEVNAAAQRLYGYSSRELVGESLAKVYPGHRNPIDAILSAIHQRRNARYEATAVRKNGNAIRVVGLAVPQVISGSLVGLYQFGRHISVRSGEGVDEDRPTTVRGPSSSSSGQTTKPSLRTTNSSDD